MGQLLPRPSWPFITLIYLLLAFQGAVAFVFPVGHALAMAVSVGRVAVIPGDAAAFSALVPGLPPQPSYQPSQCEDDQKNGGPYSDNHIQQEVLIGGHVVYGGAQVVGTVVT